MKKVLSGSLMLVLWVSLLNGTATAQDVELTPERVVTRPAPGLTVPKKLAFHPDGERVTYLKAREDS